MEDKDLTLVSALLQRAPLTPAIKIEFISPPDKLQLTNPGVLVTWTNAS